MDFPQPSIPSRAISRPPDPPVTRSRAPSGRPWCGAAALLAGAFVAAAFLAGAFVAAVFLAAFLAGAFLAGAFLAGAFLAAAFFRVDGPAARRSARSSEPRSTVSDSTSSPLRSEALVVPSVT